MTKDEIIARIEKHKARANEATERKLETQNEIRALRASGAVGAVGATSSYIHDLWDLQNAYDELSVHECGAAQALGYVLGSL